jgi:hypothetical protein
MKSQYGFNAAEKFARFHRISWKQALNLVAGAPLRLHHYRDIRTQMLRDALRDIDCKPEKEESCHA